MSGHEIPWHRRIGVRIGVVVALVVFVADLLTLPLWSGYVEWRYPQWFEPQELRDAADELERTGTLEWVSAEDRRWLLVESTLFAILLALFAGVGSRRAWRRDGSPGWQSGRRRRWRRDASCRVRSTNGDGTRSRSSRRR